MIFKHSKDMIGRCRVYMQTKITRKSFFEVNRTSSFLKLIYNNVCDMNNKLTRGDKKYFATFIDDFYRYCYVNLMHSKDQVSDNFKTHKMK